jgi:uncharacterized protein (DUF1330 family)
MAIRYDSLMTSYAKSSASHIEPSASNLAALGAVRPDGPFVALNLNRYRERADYPADSCDANVSGREAYFRYGVVAFAAIRSVGGKILWSADAREIAIGCDHDRYDEVVAVWYPSRAAFLALDRHPGYREALELHRRAAIEQACLLFFEAGPEPKLDSPFGA